MCVSPFIIGPESHHLSTLVTHWLDSIADTVFVKIGEVGQILRRLPRPLPHTLSIFGHNKGTSWRRDPSEVQLSIKMVMAVKSIQDDPGPEEMAPSPTILFVRD